MAKSRRRKEILVYADWIPFKKPELVGYLYAEIVRGSEIFSFEYSAGWLKNNSALYLDPQLQNYSGTQYPQSGHSNFGVFLDSSPDRWGRLLMKRREAITAREEARTPNTLSESDFLLGVYDQSRMGGLRFKLSEDGEFINSDHQLAVPPWSSLAELQHASFMIEQSDEYESLEYKKWLLRLIAPGSSLGGARPKANVADAEGNLWIAKFPSSQDTKNIGGWEMVIHRLAEQAGILLPPAQAIPLSNVHHTFLVKRFDRAENRRIHFTSAMTLLGYKDGDNFSAGASYLEMADFIKRFGAQVNFNLEELWKRIVFSVAVANTDDHLRNHGFLLTADGWILSPMYDVNANPAGNGLSLNISENDNTLSFDLVLETAPYYKVEQKRANVLIKKIREAVSNWHHIAARTGIPKYEIEEMEPAFRFKP